MQIKRLWVETQVTILIQNQIVAKLLVNNLLLEIVMKNLMNKYTKIQSQMEKMKMFWNAVDARAIHNMRIVCLRLKMVAFMHTVELLKLLTTSLELLLQQWVVIIEIQICSKFKHLEVLKAHSWMATGLQATMYSHRNLFSDSKVSGVLSKKLLCHQNLQSKVLERYQVKVISKMDLQMMITICLSWRFKIYRKLLQAL